MNIPPKIALSWDSKGLAGSRRPAVVVSESPELAGEQAFASSPPELDEKPVPRKRDRAVLFVLAGPQLGSVFTLGSPAALIGRDSGVDVRLDDDNVSGWQARLTLRSDGASIEDLDSRDGTFVNDRRVEGRQRIDDGDHLRFGSVTVLKFSMMDSLEERALSTLFALTLRDPLTRLYNRRYFDGRLLSEFSFARRHGTLLALLLVDVDHFKAVNDAHGHQIGDAVLKLAALTMARMMRPEDVLARFGGDEFIVIARATSLRNAEILAERICHRIQALTMKLRNLELGITVSAGVALMGPGASAADAEDLLAAADQALRQAKATGRNRVVACAVAGAGSHASEPERCSTKPPRA